MERGTEGLTESRVGKSDWDETKTGMEGETDGMEEGQRCEEREITGNYNESDAKGVLKAQIVFTF